VVVTHRPTLCQGYASGRPRGGGWFCTPQGCEPQGQIAVIFEEARPAEIAPLIVDAYGLTKREGEITRLVLRGLSTAQVSEELHITPNTVRDHFKAIFDKVGVRSRRELVGQVFAQHYQPRMATGQEPGADGWFT
jgi:DNA-binding CsgD family transcriptional regulator